MDKNRFMNMVLLNYTSGSVVVWFATFILDTDLSYIRFAHMFLLVMAWIHSSIYRKMWRRGMSKKELWKIRALSGGALIAVFLITQFLYRFIHNGVEFTVKVLPPIALLGIIGIPVCSILYYVIADTIERAVIRRINAKLSRNKPE